MKRIVYSNNDWPVKTQKNYLAQIKVVGVAVYKRRSHLLVHLVLKVEEPQKSPLMSPEICLSRLSHKTISTLFVKLVVKLQEVAVIPPQTPYQAPKRTKMNREAQSSPVSKG